ncbi:hypothetical protein JHK85_013065 [Glycine max]|nr:hypothetical protein JHK85_013065 [Glycine max]
MAAEEDPEVSFGQLKKFSLPELRIATDNFSNNNILGKGGYGKVYIGRLTNGGNVAVKRLNPERIRGEDKQFKREVEMISMAVHRNLLRLIGFCMTSSERLLVYPLMVNGSLESCLREPSESKPPLEWPMRKRIALGAARGLAYLHDHCDPKIIHRDVKAANILLDDEFEAVVGDFGLARIMDYQNTHVTTAVCGTHGHIAPEYLTTGRSSEKTDVFGYGMMLLEIITGQRAFDLARFARDEDIMLLEWVKVLVKDKKLETLVDANLRGNCDIEEVEELIRVALICTQRSPYERPKMSEVVRMLEGEGLAEKWDEWLNMQEDIQNFTFNLCTPYDSNPNIQPDVLSVVNNILCLNIPKSLITVTSLHFQSSKITTTTVKGLAYLHDHCDPKIIHRDFEAANILLDEDFEAVVGDFGLAKLMDYKNTHVTAAVRGTLGHIAPEYLATGKSSEKTVVFGYGVMLLELITGQRAFNLTRLAINDEVMFLEWVVIMSPKDIYAISENTSERQEVEDTGSSPLERPTMSEVVRMLEGDGLAEKWDQWGKKEDMIQQNFSPFNLYTPCDSTSNIQLSGPR